MPEVGSSPFLFWQQYAREEGMQSLLQRTQKKKIETNFLCKARKQSRNTAIIRERNARFETQLSVQLLTAYTAKTPEGKASYSLLL